MLPCATEATLTVTLVVFAVSTTMSVNLFLSRVLSKFRIAGIARFDKEDMSTENLDNSWRLDPALLDAVNNPPIIIFRSLPVNGPMFVLGYMSLAIAMLVSGISLLVEFDVTPFSTMFRNHLSARP